MFFSIADTNRCLESCREDFSQGMLSFVYSPRWLVILVFLLPYSVAFKCGKERAIYCVGSWHNGLAPVFLWNCFMSDSPQYKDPYFWSNHLLRSRVEEILDSAERLSKVALSKGQQSDCRHPMQRNHYIFYCTTATFAVKEWSFGSNIQLSKNCLYGMSELRFDHNSLFSYTKTPHVRLWNSKVRL